MSTSVFEHIAEPWLAAKHMYRILKPGGLMFHTAPFAYFYHAAPADFWRYTPVAFQVLFPLLKPITLEFCGLSRRRDNRGKQPHTVDACGGPAFSVDAFGGWRENWSTIFGAIKCLQWENEKIKEAEQNIIYCLMRHLKNGGSNL